MKVTNVHFDKEKGMKTTTWQPPDTLELRKQDAARKLTAEGWREVLEPGMKPGTAYITEPIVVGSSELNHFQEWADKARWLSAEECAQIESQWKKDLSNGGTS